MCKTAVRPSEYWWNSAVHVNTLIVLIWVLLKTRSLVSLLSKPVFSAIQMQNWNFLLQLHRRWLGRWWFCCHTSAQCVGGWGIKDEMSGGLWVRSTCTQGRSQVGGYWRKPAAADACLVLQRASCTLPREGGWGGGTLTLSQCHPASSIQADEEISGVPADCPQRTIWTEESWTEGTLSHQHCEALIGWSALRPRTLENSRTRKWRRGCLMSNNEPEERSLKIRNTLL